MCLYETHCDFITEGASYFSLAVSIESADTVLLFSDFMLSKRENDGA